MAATYGPYPARVLDWHDGDTAHIDLDLGFAMRVSAYDLDLKPQLSCRMYGINAPELGTAAGQDAAAYARQICPPGTRVLVMSHSWDKYGGRFDGTITLPDGSDFATRMLTAGQAVPMTATHGAAAGNLPKETG